MNQNHKTDVDSTLQSHNQTLAPSRNTSHSERYRTHTLHGRGSIWFTVVIKASTGKAVPLYAMETLGGRGGIAPTHSRPRHWIEMYSLKVVI